MDLEKDCSTCRFQLEEVETDDINTRCGNCLMLTRKMREHFPSWEPKDFADGDHEPPNITYI